MLLLAFAAPEDRSMLKSKPSAGADFALKRMAIAVRFCRQFLSVLGKRKSEKLRGVGQSPTVLSYLIIGKTFFKVDHELSDYYAPILDGIIPFLLDFPYREVD